MPHTSVPTTVSGDESIIDITDQGLSLPTPPEAVIQPTVSADEVVPWVHQYVYRYEEVLKATPQQQAFYQHFYAAFLADNHLDLKGYSNYAFILLFDLLRQYDTAHRDLARLERELKTLGAYHPRTLPYAKQEFTQRASTSNDRVTVARAELWLQSYYQNPWALGTEYSARLGLSKAHVVLLNSIYYNKGAFEKAGTAFHEVIRLFCRVVDGLEDEFSKDEKTLAEVITDLADVSARKNHRYRQGSDNYKWHMETESRTLYEYILKRCDNAVREAYRHTRTKSVECTYSNGEARAAFETSLATPITSILTKLTSTIAPPDERTELALNAANTTRWKHRFEEISNGLTKATASETIAAIDELARLNRTNPSVENIYFEAAKALSSHDREAAVSFYLKYVHADLQSARVNDKQLPKTALKHIFKEPSQEEAFVQLLATLRADRSLKNALTQVPLLFEKKRKKIQLDSSTIQQVVSAHSSTVDILNEVLKEEDSSTLNSSQLKVEPEVAARAEPVAAMPAATTTVQVPSTDANLTLSDAQKELTELFANSDFFLDADAISAFAKEHGLFKNGLIDGINERCYEILDDVLIEEAEDGYQMNPDYYHQINI